MQTWILIILGHESSLSDFQKVLLSISILISRKIFLILR